MHKQLNTSLRYLKCIIVFSTIFFLGTCVPLQKQDPCISGNVPRNAEVVFSSLECLLHQDPGHRGIKNVWTNNTLLPAVQALIACENVFIATGFYITKAKAVETDGPLGAVAIARALKSLGKEAYIITDRYGQKVMEAALRQAQIDVAVETVSLNEGGVGLFDKIRIKKDSSACLVSIERVGRARDGRYYNMLGEDISGYTAPIDEIFIESTKNHPNITTIGIGDGGNEIGMGNIIEEVVKFIPRGETIASIVKSDFLITTGVSNWGGYAIAFGLYALQSQSITMLPDWEKEYGLLKSIVAAGAVDGSGESKLAVDGLDFDIHKRILIKMSEAVHLKKNALKN